jgi:hypothetical protein
MTSQQAMMNDADATEARWPNKLLGHLGHLRKTNDLFGNLAK